MDAPPRESLFRKLRTPALILLGLVGIDVGVRLTADTWKRHSPDDYAERVRVCASKPRDFVLVGGSPVSEGLRPGVISGVNWRGQELLVGYALGLSGATSSEVYHAAKHGCPTPPKLLVYGITASDINDGRQEPHGPWSLMTAGDVYDWMTTRPESGKWAAKQYLFGKLSQSWAAYHHRHGIRMWAALRAEALFPGCCPASAKEATELVKYADGLRDGNGYAPSAGFVETRYDEVKRVGLDPPPFHFLDRYRTGSHLKAVHRLIDWAEANGTTVVLLDVPVTADLEAMYPTAFAEYRERLAEIERTRNVFVLRANRTAVGLEDKHFADTIHLNLAGAWKLSRWLRARLDEAGSAPEAGLLVARGQAPGGKP